MRARSRWLALAFASLAGCSGGDTPRDGAPPTDGAPTDVAGDANQAHNLLETVPAAETLAMPGLTSDAHVIRTEGDVPHVYASNAVDLARVHGFTMARHRFFVMDMARRLALGTVSSLLGDAAITTDMQSRTTGMNTVAALLLEAFTPEQGRALDAFAEGVNFYIDRARTQREARPPEYTAAAAIIGRANPADLMARFTRRDVAAVLATLIYNLGWETDDIGRTRAVAALASDPFGSAPLGALRRAGMRPDIFDRITQPREVNATAGWGLETGTSGGMGPIRPPPPPPRAPNAVSAHVPPAGPSRSSRAPSTDGAASVRTDPGDPRLSLTARGTHALSPALRTPRAMLDRLAEHLAQIQLRLRRVEGFGSNAWAVMGSRTRDGAALLAGDGHLPLTVPALFYQIGLDTRTLGAQPDGIQQLGLTIPGLPIMAVGTNGYVAWSQTQFAGDITDWYREELVLGADGMPSATRFAEAPSTRPLTRVDEMYEIANVPALGSVGRTETWARFVTFDGRLITSIEGRRVTRDEALGPGEARVMVNGDFVVPGDTDGDGVVTAISYDHPSLDGGNVLAALDGFGHARNVRELREASRGLVAYSQNIAAADSSGSVLFTSYQSVPCRGYLPRAADRTFLPGADPRQLLDGTTFRGFRIPLRNGVVDEAPGAADPYACVVPFDQMPAAIDPDRGYVVTANNDPAGITSDNNLLNDPWYVGGPWNDGYRAARISQRLADLAQSHSADEDAMAAVQSDVRSGLGEDFAPVLLDAIAQARTAAAGTPAPGTAEERLAQRYRAASAAYDAVAQRLSAWSAAGLQARAGVATFYHPTVDAAERDDAVATMIFNAWIGRFVSATFDDEHFPDGIFDDGNTSRIRTLRLMVNGRGAGNTSHLASFNAATGESAYFDVLDTAPVETSREVALLALDGALAFLRSAPTSADRGGFGTDDTSAWLWGYRHHLRFESILGSFLGDNPMLQFLAEGYSITPRQLPLMPGLPATDPRAALTGFPRPGDQWAVDAANPGLGGTDFTFGSGPNFRMVIALRGDQTTGRNVLPGGQSGQANAPSFSDQARLWLGNQTLPMYLTARDVVAHAVRREYFRPMP